MRTIRVGQKPALALDVAGEQAREGEDGLVVLLHGIGSDRSIWRDQVEAFGRHFRTAAWDARGYGDSDDYEGPLDFADFSRDLLGVLDHFEVERADLVGLSMGGRIALDFYGRHPRRVRSLTLADTSANHPDATDPAKIEEVLRQRKQPLLEGKTPADLAPDMARAVAGPHISAAAMARLIDSLSRLHAPSYIKTLDAVTRYRGFVSYADIAAPTLVINGTEDRIAKIEIARDMARLIPDHRFVALEQTGHISNLENPEGFNAAVLDFLMTLTRRRTPEASPA